MTRALPCVACALLLSACGTLPNGRGVGQDVTLWPGGARLQQALVAAARDRHTWVPAAGAVIVNAARWDSEIADWAVENTPIFGSPARAEERSDDLRDATRVASYATLLATPSGDTAAEIIPAKLKGAALQAVTVSVNAHVTNGIKRAVGRERPNAINDRSFPSGHSSEAHTHAGLARQNIDYIQVGASTQTLMSAGIDVIAAGAAWARVEAGMHYPSDVLAGAALGNFLAQFFYQAFMGVDGAATVAVEPVVGPDAVLIGARIEFR